MAFACGTYRFDYYNILPGQGRYNDPMLIEKGTWGNDPHANPRTGKVYKGHSTDVIGSEAIKYMENRDKSKPFFMMCHFKLLTDRGHPPSVSRIY